MLNLPPELLAFTRACEHLLTKKVPLTEDERDLLEYYINDMAREFLSDKCIVSKPPQTLQANEREVSRSTTITR